jgi:cytochrome c556
VIGRGNAPLFEAGISQFGEVFARDWKKPAGRLFMKFASAIAVAAIAIGATAVLAQQDPIAARKALMKANGQAAGGLAKMVKGEAPFDADAAKKAFATFEDAASKMPNLFPADSKTGGETTAAPKIWEDTADFKARFVKLGNDSKAASSSVKDLDSLKTTFPELSKNCGGCHEIYRIKKS